MLGRLIREDNVYANSTITYTYDGNNNLTSKTTYAYTTSPTLSGGTVKTYTYGDAAFKDRLTSYNGAPITYDEIGNPLSYLGKTFTWKNGRQLATWSNGSIYYVYQYDSNGIRLSKAASSGTITNYLYNGTQLLKETNGANTIWYLYDNLGIVGLELNGVSYYYVRNLQGDVTKIVDTSGNTVVSYIYDSWGKVLSVAGTLASTVGALNPIRYRGYYYDTETNLYYLNSRYYDPETGRFISTDVVAEGGNLYTYCMNDPINNIDPTGYFSWKTFWKGVGRVAVGVLAVTAAVAVFASGVAPVAMLVVAGVTAVAGLATFVNGTADIGEAASGYNYMRDGVFDGNEKAYNIYAGVTEAVAVVGTAVCGGWLKFNQPRISAYKNVGNYNYTNTTKKYFPNGDIVSKGNEIRPYMQSQLAQKNIIKYGTMRADKFGYMFTLGNSELGVNTVKSLIWHFLIRG